MVNPSNITKPLSANDNAPMTRFNFRQYRLGDVYHNNTEEIDFVTNGKSLYVCVVDGYVSTYNNIDNESGFLKLVSQGQRGDQGVPGDDGKPGTTPNLTFHFIDRQLIIKENGVIKIASPDLTGAAWRPTLNGDTLNWELSKDKTVPQPIDLHDLTAPERPILLRTNSDNTKRSDEQSGPANFIQWKYEGDAEWTNLMSISELMNLALAGVSFWPDNDGYWHFGHKEVISATYDSTAEGRQIISNVELGDVLYDAGKVPIANYSLDIEEIKDRLDELENKPDTDLSNYYTKGQSDAKYQPVGNYLTEHQPIKTISGESLIGYGDLTLNGFVKSLTVNGQRKTPVSGNISINFAENPIINIKIENSKLYKKSLEDSDWVEVGNAGGGSGQGCDRCWSEQDILNLINTATSNFLTRNLADALYSKVTVQSTFNPVDQSKKQQIAVITVNGQTTNIYAPISSGDGGSSSGSSVGSESIYVRVDDTAIVTISGEIRLDQLEVSYPDNNWEYNSPQSPWTSKPSGVNETYPYEFVSVRKLITVNDQQVWDTWSTPSLWAKYGKDGESGEPGGVGPAGDQYERVYGRVLKVIPVTGSISLISQDDVTTITTSSEEYQTDGYLPKFLFTFSDSTTLSVRCTPVPQGVSENNMYEFESIRRKHNGVWTEFAPPTLYHNWVMAGLKDEEIQDIKDAASQAAQENINLALDEIDAAKTRLTATENRLDAIDGPDATLFTDKQNALIQAITSYEDQNQKSFADLIVDGKKSEIEAWAGAQVGPALSNAGLNIDGLKATVLQWGDFIGPNGDLNTVKQSLSAIDGRIQTIATSTNANTTNITSVGNRMSSVEGRLDNFATHAEVNAVNNNVTNVQSTLNAMEGTLTNTVSSSKYLTDKNGNLLDINGNIVGHFNEDSDFVKTITYTDGTDWHTEEFLVKSFVFEGTTYPVYFSKHCWEVDCLEAYDFVDGEIAYYEVQYDSENKKCILMYDDHNDEILCPVESGLKLCTLVSDAVSQIKQQAGRVDIDAIDGDAAAQIIVKANEHTGSDIVLDADRIHIQGDLNAQNAAISTVWVNNAKITKGTIQEANINDCTINSKIQSSDYDPIGKEGFLIDPIANKFDFYGTLNANQIVVGSGQSEKLLPEYIDTVVQTTSNIYGNISNDYQKVGVDENGLTVNNQTYKATINAYSGITLQNISSIEYRLNTSDNWTTLTTATVANGTLSCTLSGTNAYLTYSIDQTSNFGLNTVIVSFKVNIANDGGSVFVDWTLDPAINTKIYTLRNTGDLITQLLIDKDHNIRNPYSNSNRTYYSLWNDTSKLDPSEYVLFFNWDNLTPEYIGSTSDNEYVISFVSSDSDIDYFVKTDWWGKSGYTIKAYLKKNNSTDWSTYASEPVVDYEFVPVIYDGSDGDIYKLDISSDVIPCGKSGFKNYQITASLKLNEEIVQLQKSNFYVKYYDSIEGLCEIPNNKYSFSNNVLTFNTRVLNDSVENQCNYLQIGVQYNGINLYKNLAPLNDGRDGNDAVPYMYKGTWQSNTTYVKNDQQIDVVKHENVWYMCNVSESNKSSFTSSDWTAFVGNFENIATNLILAERGTITNLEIDAGNVTGKLTADQIEAGSIKTNELETFDGNNRSIIAAGNVLSVNDSLQNQKILITGNNISVNSANTCYPIYSGPYNYRTRVNNPRDGYQYSSTIVTNLGAFRLTSSNLSVTIPTIQTHITMPNEYGRMTSFNITINVYKGTSIAVTGVQLAGGSICDSNLVFPSQTLNDLSSGDYKIKLVTDINWSGSYKDGTLITSEKIEILNPGISVVVNDNSPSLVAIGANGLNVKVGNLTATFAKDVNQSPSQDIMKLEGINSSNQHYGIMLNSNGIRILDPNCEGYANSWCELDSWFYAKLRQYGLIR